MKYLQEEIKDKIYAAIKDMYEIDRDEIVFSIPPQRIFGDLSTTVPFILAKRVGEKPFVIGNRIVAALKGRFPTVAEIKLAGGGFVNFYFDKNFLLSYLAGKQNPQKGCQKHKVIVEHTSINPNKSAHIGHLRNACLGDTLARCLEFLGYDVEVQNYLDDTGIQVADVIWGLLYHRKITMAEIRGIDNLAAELWSLYAEVHRLFEKEETYKEERNRVHQKIEDKIDPEYTVANYVAQEVLKNHIAVMERLGIRYDLLVRESDIIELGFFEDAARTMGAENIMYPSQDPEKKGCQVIKYRKENIEKIVVRSNGTVTYIGKDIAYAMWKAGLFTRDFYYQKFYTYDDTGKEIYISASQGEAGDFAFGNAATVYNVIGIRQAYLQNIISQEVVTPLSPADDKKEAIHFSYEMVSLTPRCVSELGFELGEEDRKKSHVDVSGRKGIAVKGEDLIDELVDKSRQEVEARDPGIAPERALKIARDIAVGALRYFMIKFNAGSIIAFDFKDALAFEGDTGPYLQYTVVRINSILRKLGDDVPFPDLQSLDLAALEPKECDIYYEILHYLTLIESQVELAVKNRDISGVPNYTYGLCQKINHYYHLYSIVAEENPAKKSLRIALVLLVKKQLQTLFHLMGIPVPEKM